MIPLHSKIPTEFLGWAVGKDKYGDELGLMHLLGTKPEVLVAHKICKPAERQQFGQIEAKPEGVPTRYPKCQLCLVRYGKYKETLRRKNAKVQ